MEMKNTEVKMNKLIYLGMSILDISKTLMCEFWYDYIKPKYGDRAKLCYTDTDSFVIYIKTEDFYKDIANDVETWFDTSTYDENDKRPFPIGKSKKAISLFENELSGKIMKEFAALRAKTYGTKKCVIKCGLMFETYVDSLFNNKIILKSQQRFKSDHPKVYTEEVNKLR